MKTGFVCCLSCFEMPEIQFRRSTFKGGREKKIVHAIFFFLNPFHHPDTPQWRKSQQISTDELPCSSRTACVMKPRGDIYSRRIYTCEGQ